jgi:Gas vesicle protein K
MEAAEIAHVESESIRDFARVMQQDDKIQWRPQYNGAPARARLDLDPDRLKNGLGQLVLTLVKLLHELLQRQALRRIDAGSLTEEQIERLGLTLMGQAEEIDRLRREFGLEEDDLNLDLGPLGRLF